MTFFLLLFRGGLYHIVNSGEDLQGGNPGTLLSFRGGIRHTRPGAVLNGMLFWFLRSRALIIEIWDVRGPECETIIPFKLNVLETVS
jgi:hypothetical protein